MTRLLLLCGLWILAASWASAGTSLPRYDHIVVVVDENQAFSQMVGNASAPFINSLASRGALLTKSFATTHPSQPNYLELFSGSTQGVTTDLNPGTFSAANVGSLLIASGETFTGFSEDLPSVGFTGDSSGNYVRKHNPWVDFSNVPSASNRPFSDFPADFTLLPNLAFVIPNLVHDMHDGTVAQGDSWLQTNLGAYITWAQTHNSLFVLTFDEDNGLELNHVMTVIVGDHVIVGSYADAITHDNILRTVEDALRTGYAGNSALVSPLTSPFARVPSKAGIFRSSAFMTAEDVNGNIAWDAGTDRAFFFGSAGDMLIQGDWDGSGTTKLGIFRPNSAMFALDMNGNGAWDPGIDKFGFFGGNGDLPIVGDWTGDGKSKVGIYRPTTQLFALDVNNNLTYDAGTDKIGHFGISGDVPILGDWTGDGITKIGIYRPSTSLFAEDVNNNLAWDGGTDKAGVFGVPGDTPIVGDWTGDGVWKIGIYRGSTSLWSLDINNNLSWDAGTDKSGVFGAPGDQWVVGDWDGSGVTRAGIFRPGNGLWGLDKNGNLAWDAGVDLSGVLGAPGDTPVVGRW